MPRLLLVDDNQSIHKIAETLLTATDIQLTCAASGAEALEMVGTAGPFDAALLDTTMQGMDGWQLLARLRGDPATALLPIAMMAGVLDAVDPEIVRNAPIQGFLKKPVELRDLADRVRTLAATVVEPPPEPEPEPAPEPVPEASPDNQFATMPYLRVADHGLPAEGGHPSAPDADLLLLEPGDILPEPAPAPRRDDTLELEELDLDLLKGIAEAERGGDLFLPPESSEVPTREDLASIPDFAPEDAYQSGALNLDDEPSRVITDELPDLGADLDPLTAPAPAPPPHDYWSDQSESMLGLGDGPADFGMDSFLEQEPSSEPTPAFVPEVAEALPSTPVHELPETLPPPLAELELEPEEATIREEEVLAAGRDTVPPWAVTQNLPVEAPEPPAVAEAPVPEPPAAEAKAAAPEAPADLLAALLADPALMDQLAKAVIARMGDQALREIAWEVMPELADRLRRN